MALLAGNFQHREKFMKNIILLLLAWLPVPLLAAEPVLHTLKLKPVAGMTRAELKYFAPPANCAGALVLCPGWNGDGGAMLRDPGWQELARKHQLALVGLSFASDDEDGAEAGYHHSAKGSGQLLVDGVRQITKREVPLVLFGFSRGGQFVHAITCQFPEKVRTWACTGIGPTEEMPKETKAKPPGLLVCGLDDGNTSTSREAYLSGLRAKWPVCWLGVEKSGHVIEPRAAAWVRTYFDAVLALPRNNAGVWAEVGDERGLEGFLVRCWFPDEKTQDSWKKFQ